MSEPLTLFPTSPSEMIPGNRGYETKIEESDISIKNLQISLMKIDETIINYLTDTIKPTIVDNDRIVPVPVLYASAERWKTIRRDGYLRDQQNDKIQTPIISIRRSNVARNPLTNPSNKYLYTDYKSQWNKRNAYDRFAILNGIKPSQESVNVVIPDYVDLTYEMILWTEYQEQMNQLIEQINVENDEFWGLRNMYKFKVRIENYSTESELPAEMDRMVRTTFNMKVSAYLVPERMVNNFVISSTSKKRFTNKKVIAFVEAVNSISV